jgi:hypothetical protein
MTTTNTISIAAGSSGKASTLLKSFMGASKQVGEVLIKLHDELIDGVNGALSSEQSIDRRVASNFQKVLDSLVYAYQALQNTDINPEEKEKHVKGLEVVVESVLGEIKKYDSLVKKHSYTDNNIMQLNEYLEEVSVFFDKQDSKSLTDKILKWSGFSPSVTTGTLNERLSDVKDVRKTVTLLPGESEFSKSIQSALGIGKPTEHRISFDDLKAKMQQGQNVKTIQKTGFKQ